MNELNDVTLDHVQWIAQAALKKHSGVEGYADDVAVSYQPFTDKMNRQRTAGARPATPDTRKHGLFLIEDDAYGLLEPTGVPDRQFDSRAHLPGGGLVQMHRAGASRILPVGARSRGGTADDEPRFYMAVNLKTAASLGLSLSDVLVARANQVIE